VLPSVLFLAFGSRALHTSDANRWIQDNLLASFEQFRSDAATSASVEERLESVGTIILKWMSVSDTIGMI
jgi:hypothetical protein